MPPKNNKKKKGGGGKSRPSGSSSSQQAFPTGDFEAQPDPRGTQRDGDDRGGGTGTWRQHTATKETTDDKTPEELIAMCAPPPRLRETDDPEAVAHLEAHALFAAGVRCGRHGDLDGAKAQIAPAYLLDDRCMHVRVFFYTPPAAASAF